MSTLLKTSALVATALSMLTALSSPGSAFWPTGGSPRLARPLRPPPGIGRSPWRPSGVVLGPQTGWSQSPQRAPLPRIDPCPQDQIWVCPGGNWGNKCVCAHVGHHH